MVVDVMKNKGKNTYRFKQNPLELRYAEEWESLNTILNGALNGRGVLDYILSDDKNMPNGEVSDRDREVAATVIQWLGSPVGQKFIKKVQG